MSSSRKLLQRLPLCLAILLSLSSPQVNARGVHRMQRQQGASGTPSGVFTDTWIINTTNYNPDCQQDRPTAMVNGMLPGPLIRIVEGTQVVITVTNRQAYPVTIHWHGVTQNGTQWYDGVHGVTQCDLLQNMSFTYNFSTWGHAGTLWWHTHAGVLRNTVFGGLFVEPAPGTSNRFGRRPTGVPVKAQFNFFLSDWYWDTPDVLATNSPGWVPPDAILINGASYFKGATCQRKEPFEITVERGKWYRLRVVNSGLFAAINFAIQGHYLYTYEVEAGYLRSKPFWSYTVLSGQSYQFLFRATNRPGRYWIRGRPLYDSVDTAPGLAFLRYKGVRTRRLPSTGSFLEGPKNDIVPDLMRRTVAAKAPSKWINRVDKLVVLEMNTDKPTGHYSMNNFTLTFPQQPPLYLAYKKRAAALGTNTVLSLPPKGLGDYSGPSRKGFGTIELAYNSVVQLVIQNGKKIPMNPHPFHLHGHNFYVVGWGNGTFDVDNWKTQKYNLENPVYRNTAWVEQAGWTAVRFRADNPGVWLLHCHLEPHSETSMLAVFEVKKDGGIPPMPRDYPTCAGKKLK